MLVFHGTSGDRALLDQIFAAGLVPAPRPWAHEATGVEAHVFACTQPIGTRGGDPLAFAQRGAWRDHRAWLLVIDLPDDAAVRGAVPNEELERYWLVRAFAGAAFADPAALRALIAATRARRCAARDLLRYRVVRTADGLCPAPPDGHTLVQFEAAYHRARPTQRARVAASYGLRVPAWFADDPHYGSCLGCMWNLFEVDIVAPDVGFACHRGAWSRLDLTTLGALVDATGRWLAHHGDPPVPTFAALQALPPPADVPRALWRDFATADLATRRRLPDTQLLLGPVPPAQLVGAIDLGTARRLAAHVRPGAGQTLLGNLRHLVRTLVARRAGSPCPVVIA